MMGTNLEPVMLGNHYGPCQRCGWQRPLEDTARALCALCLDAEPVWSILDRLWGRVPDMGAVSSKQEPEEPSDG